jgi:hypothetical protein
MAARDDLSRRSLVKGAARGQKFFMAAPVLPSNPSLADLREQIVHTHFALSLEASVKTLAAPFTALLAQHQTVVQGQDACWDAQTLAGLKVRRADRRLDAHVDGFVGDLVHVYGDRAAAGVQHYLRGRTVSEIKRTVLGPEVEIVAEWITSIANEKSKKLRAWGEVFTADLADAEAATKESTSADTANRIFRERGPLAAFVTALVTARDELHNKLEAQRLTRAAEGLGSDWPNTFFMAPKRPAPDDASRKARAAQRAEKKLERERKTAARADALAKLREAREALAALKKK